MREIKFRGKTTKDFPNNKNVIIPKDEWIHGGIIYDTDRVWIDIPYYGEIKVDKNTVGQYTGLKDKNGKEIYEGDIVKSFFVDNDKNGNEIYKYLIKEVKYDEIMCCYNIDAFENLEVTGNRYDNQNLIKEE